MTQDELVKSFEHVLQMFTKIEGHLASISSSNAAIADAIKNINITCGCSEKKTTTTKKKVLTEDK